MLHCLRTFVWAAISLYGGMALADDSYFATPERLDNEGFQEFFAQVAPGVYMAGQPTEAGLAKAKALGVTTVVNLRTDFEMQDRSIVPFDEQASAAKLGLAYVHVPQGGPNTPYSPTAVERFAQAVDAAEGNVLLHCTVAWRATHLWTAYLVKHRGLSVADALAIGRQLNLGGMPLEGFLGQELVIDIK